MNNVPAPNVCAPSQPVDDLIDDVMESLGSLDSDIVDLQSALSDVLLLVDDCDHPAPYPADGNVSPRTRRIIQIRDKVALLRRRVSAVRACVEV